MSKNITLAITRLADGRKIASLSGHEFKCSDGTVIPAQPKEIIDAFSIERIEEIVQLGELKAVKTVFRLSPEQLQLLHELEQQVDILIAPILLLDALKAMGVRDKFTRVVGFNATPETRRNSPNEKVVDISRWAY